MRLVTALVVWVGAVAGAAEVSAVVAKSIHHSASSPASSSTSGASPSVTFSQPSSPASDPSSIKATDSRSLFRTANFARALAAVRSGVGATADIENFALYPGYLSVSATKGSRAVDFYVDANGRVVQTAMGGSPPNDSAFRLAQVAPDAPATLAQRIATAGHIRTSQLHYMVAQVDPSTKTFRWLVYAVDGSPVEYFEAVGATGPLFEYRANSSSGLQRVSG